MIHLKFGTYHLDYIKKKKKVILIFFWHDSITLPAEEIGQYIFVLFLFFYCEHKQMMK